MTEKTTVMNEFLEVVARLRGEGGCPWDREQTLESLRPYLIEEAYEVIDAIEDDDISAHREELGDLLLQVVMQSQIRKESGAFNFNDVVAGIKEKMISRHPHVFGDVQVADSAEVLRNWEKNKSKQEDGGNRSVLAGVPRHLPALQKAQRVQSRAARVGFDWREVKDVLAKVEEELAEVKDAMESGDKEKLADELGDLLFSVVNLSRFYDISAEDALNGTIAKFKSRFTQIEQYMFEQGKQLSDCSLEEMDRIWNIAKEQELSTGESNHE